MVIRVIVFFGAAGILAATGIWAWSNHCERYKLCHPVCRVAANGVEYWKTVSSVSARSEWVAAKASPGSECLSLLAVMQGRYPGRQVAIDYVNLANERKPAPFYQYDCTFDIKEPVFVLARNQECATRAQEH